MRVDIPISVKQAEITGCGREEWFPENHFYVNFTVEVSIGDADASEIFHHTFYVDENGETSYATDAQDFDNIHSDGEKLFGKTWNIVSSDVINEVTLAGTTEYLHQLEAFKDGIDGFRKEYGIL